MLVTTTLVAETCYSCGVAFGMPSHLRADRLRDHKSFWCPNGHAQQYTGKTEEQRLREQLDAARSLATRERERRQTEERSARAYRGHVTRLKRRLGAGKCPCCSQEFPDVAEHLAAEHPGYTVVDEHAEAATP